jgi:hypothetical protein
MVVYTIQGAPGWCYDTFFPDGLGNRQTSPELLVGSRSSGDALKERIAGKIYKLPIWLRIPIKLLPPPSPAARMLSGAGFCLALLLLQENTMFQRKAGKVNVRFQVQF